MKPIHVECLPDETLVRKIGFPRKSITHHTGKSRVFYRLSKSEGHLAMVDEDPGSPQSSYEKNLLLVSDKFGVKLFKDSASNKVLVLQGKLEDWIISVCHQAQIDIEKFGLPVKANELHRIINQRLAQLEKLIDHLQQTDNPHFNYLKSLLA